MKKITVYFFAGLGVALAAFFACFLVDSVQVSADILTVVDLTPEQTLALYGSSITGQYYTGSEWRAITFDYYGKSSDFNTSNQGHITEIWTYDYLNYTSSQIDSLLRDNEFLFYRALVPTPSPADRESKIQFSIDFSVDISSIAYFRQIVGFTRYLDSNSPALTSYLPYIPDFSVNSSVSYSASPIQSIGYGQQFTASNPYGSVTAGYFTTPLSLWFNSTSYYAPIAFCDVYLQDIDSSTGSENDFAITGQTFAFNRAYPYTLLEDQTVPPNQPDATSSSYYVIAISTPRVTDSYVLPEPPQTTPNYSSQLDSLVTIGGQNTTILQQILAKLDLIYQKMQQGESSSTLQDPEKIGFDSRTKQEILDGVASADSVLDGVQPSDLPTGASDSIWYFWGRLKNIMPPSLWALYLFALIGGFVGWILYGKRGG